MLDRQDIVSAATRHGFDALGWSVTPITADLFERVGADRLPHADIVTANLFLHHFTDPQLAAASAAPGARWRRCSSPASRAARRCRCMAGRLLWVIGCNDVTRHDAVVSVEAGFTDGELSAIWPEPDRWELHEQRGAAVHALLCRAAQTRVRAVNRETKHDAIVIGGGPAGATAALLLARAGWSVAVVEKDEFPRRKVCGEFISATSMPLLHELGLLDDFVQRAGPPGPPRRVVRPGCRARSADAAAAQYDRAIS